MYMNVMTWQPFIVSLSSLICCLLHTFTVFPTAVIVSSLVEISSCFQLREFQKYPVKHPTVLLTS